MKRKPFYKQTVGELLMNTTGNDNGCMIWNGMKDGCGYAAIYVNGKSQRISRIVLGITSLKVYACHKCDNPACINPAHLFAGSQSDNIQDHWNKVKKGIVKRSRWHGIVQPA